MNTIMIKLDKDEIRKEDLETAATVLKNGGLVAFPTETVYGLGANALDAQASSKIYKAKGRPSDNPLIVHIAKIEDMESLAKDIPDTAYRLAQVFWPGPLTIIMKKKDCVPYGTTGGLETVGIRLPANKIARDLILHSGVFIAAPSANVSGKPSPTKAEHVQKDLSGRVDLILDGGDATLGLESTIVDLSGDLPMILRPGCITKTMLENVIGPIEYDPVIFSEEPSGVIKPKAPGMKYRHYAPEGTLVIYSGSMDKVTEEINRQAKEKIEEGISVGIIATKETKDYYKYGIIKAIGTRKDEASIAAGLYRILREFDELHTEYIYSESFSDNELGQAIMNRLLKAAGYRIIKLEE
ncbi:threonylcarbamoyl-AMP synthase [Mobilitalea sibirica]|uniref:Threonylcarbamoyl-AMP synthase n=1 Tax=Mobilitalea sibirica TaxID=1462919 RepID=A0A8J7KZQ4_9FIRM|nr:L-threonylcarbamoyladenylate synthase [Mobilitalea sibirica]MBH1940713.1 threonylcarbamoyl-AMP synthase [Mobilitalea sibirica]